MYCFISIIFVLKYNISTKPTPSMELKLFDRLSNNIINKTASLPVIFLLGDQIILNICIILLDSFCLLVLGYNWLI